MSNKLKCFNGLPMVDNSLPFNYVVLTQFNILDELEIVDHLYGLLICFNRIVYLLHLHFYFCKYPRLRFLFCTT